MPACRDCHWRDGDVCRAHERAKEELKRPLPPPPTGACTVAIVESYLPLIRPGMSVLEIGCGTWSRIKDHCDAVGADYHGLDVLAEYYGIPTIATRLENLAALSYADESFDIVVGNQTMEHWGEHGCTLEWGLYQCFRVTKKEGLVLLNVPIHFHGTKEFVHGHLDVLSALFSRFSNTVIMESWGNPTDPLPAYYPHPDFPALRGKPAYVLDIRASRDREEWPRVSNVFGFHGKLAQVFHYSASYNLYRLKKKLQGLRGA